jgi:hypothetical protein
MILLSKILAWIHLVVGCCAAFVGLFGMLTASEFISAVVAILVGICLLRGAIALTAAMQDRVNKTNSTNE